MNQPYSTKVFQNIQAGSRRSAEEILPFVLQLIQPASAVDIGCGSGEWLAVLRERGVEDVWGVDGPWVDPALLQIPVDRFQAHDLRQPLRMERRFDLVISLEVAGHLPEAGEENYVELLTSLGPVVLFSAPIPHQKGIGLRPLPGYWPEFWAELFGKRGYVLIDCIRPKIWNNERVPHWYAQNMFLYAHQSELERNPELARAHRESGAMPLSVVHPKLFVKTHQKHQRALEQKESVGELARKLLRTLLKRG